MAELDKISQNNHKRQFHNKKKPILLTLFQGSQRKYIIGNASSKLVHSAYSKPSIIHLALQLVLLNSTTHTYTHTSICLHLSTVKSWH